VKTTADGVNACLGFRAVFVFVLLSTGVSSHAQSVGVQRVTGTVRDETSGLPLSGAVVSAMAAGDSAIARTVSDSRGAFALPTDRAASIRVVHIGYLPTTMPVGRESSIDVALSRLPWSLPAVSAESRSECARRDDAPRAAILWTQAQAGLLAALVARQSTPATMRIVRYYRTIDRGHAGLPRMDHGVRDRIDTQSTRTTTEVGTRVFAAARPASYFAQHGYVASSPAGYVIFGPDEEVLLDSSFAATHCFRLAHDADHRGQIGIAFEPTRGRDVLTDLVGTLWIDSAQAALRSVHYTYTDLHLPNVNNDGAGGLMTFETAANGIPIMVSWRLVEPQGPPEGQFPWEGATGGGRGLGIVVRLNPEIGAQLATATWSDGTVWSAHLPSVGGVVVDPDTKRPRADIPIRLLNGDRLAVTDSAGRFQFDDLIAGPYLFAVEDTLLAVFRTLVGADQPRIRGAKPSQAIGDWVKRENKRFDSQPLVQAIQVDSGPNPEIRVDLPNADRAFRRACGRELTSDSSGVLAAWVLRGAVAAEGATIVARWTESRTVVGRTVRTDDQGRALVCGVPRGSTVTLSTTIGSAPPVQATQQISGDRLVTMGVVRFQ
jgi:hypothetical protein